MISAFDIVHKGPLRDPAGVSQTVLRAIKTAKGRLVPTKPKKIKSGKYKPAGRF